MKRIINGIPIEFVESTVDIHFSSVAVGMAIREYEAMYGEFPDILVVSSDIALRVLGNSETEPYRILREFKDFLKVYFIHAELPAGGWYVDNYLRNLIAKEPLLISVPWENIIYDED